MNIEIIKVKTKFGEINVYLDNTDISYGKCRGCGKQILWGLTENEKNFPISKVMDEHRYYYVSHFADCSNAEDFRKEEKMKLSFNY